MTPLIFIQRTVSKYSLSTAMMIALLALSGNAASSQETAWDRAVADPAAAQLARPNKTQYNWQEQELAMFVQLDPATIQGVEYDNGTTPMSEIKFEKLDVNEWCRAAKAFGAKEIVFMLAHSGGFCMWPSETTKYHIGNTPYKNGKGDVVKEYAEACRKHGLNMGFYFWMPRPASAGNAEGTISYNHAVDPVKTWDEARRVHQARFHEIMDRLGPEQVFEIWIDQPIMASLGKEIASRAPNAVVQAIGCRDPYFSIRWPGTETGTVKYPCWSTLKKSQVTKTAKTQFEADRNQSQEADDPDGDYWAPHEADVPLHNHYWHLRPGALEHRRTLSELMECYEKSVGRNSFLILNCAPQADGSVHPDDMKRYEEFGAEIKRRFGQPLAVAEQIPGNEVVLDLGGMKTIDYTDLWEDYRYGHRIREYVIEGFDGEKWIKIANGTAVGRRKIDPISPVTVSKVRVSITKNVGTPLIRKFQVHAPLSQPGKPISAASQ